MALGKLGGQARVSDRAFDALYTAIIHGDLEAGSRLQVRDLAESLGTSMMPVREALNRLEEFGLVETLPYRGAVVKTFPKACALKSWKKSFSRFNRPWMRKTQRVFWMPKRLC